MAVQRSIREGLDIDNHRAISCLLASCIGGHCESVKFFIAFGVDINGVDSKGNSAVHQCAVSGQLECLKVLVDNGADLDVKYEGVTLLQQASVYGKADIVEYLMDHLYCTRAEKIEAFELLEASYAGDVNDLQGARNYWLQSLEERGRAEPGDNVPPKTDEPHPAFGNDIREFQTEQELTAYDTEEMLMQSLIIRDRIVGLKNHQYLNKFAVSLAYYYAKRGDLDRAISLIAYILDVEQKSGMVCCDTLKTFCRMYDMFRYLMRRGFSVEYQDVMAVFVKIVDIIEHDMKPQLDQKQPWNCTLYSHGFDTAVHLIDILAQLQPSISADERLQLRKVLYRFVHLNVRDEEGRTALHLACLNTVFSPLAVVQLLLEVGADPQAVSLSRDTPLHTLATNEHDDHPHVIKLLLNSGTHYDTCNARGKCFTELLAGDNAFKYESPMDYCSLKCLSAKAVLRYAIPYESIVPTHLSEFIEMH